MKTEDCLTFCDCVLEESALFITWMNNPTFGGFGVKINHLQDLVIFVNHMECKNVNAKEFSIISFTSMSCILLSLICLH